MKILIVNTVGMGYEGISTTIMQLFSIMDKENMDINLLSVKEMDDTLRKEIIKLGINIINIECRKSNPARYAMLLYLHMKRNKYDLIHAHGNSATLLIELLIAKLAGCKVRIAHSRNTQCDYVKIDRLLRPFFHRTYTYGLSCGKQAGMWLFGKYPFTVLHNGKDLSLFQYNPQTRIQIRQRYNWNDNIVVGHVGHFTYQKNHDFLLDIFYELTKINKKYVLCLIGDGSEMEHIISKAKHYSINKKIVYTGQISNVSQMLQAIDLMIFPSRFEGLPNVVIECQAAGLPCLISSNITKECAVTDLVYSNSLNDSPQKWAVQANKIDLKNRKKNSVLSNKKLKESGFDIYENAQELKELYFDLIKDT